MLHRSFMAIILWIDCNVCMVHSRATKAQAKVKKRINREVKNAIGVGVRLALH